MCRDDADPAALASGPVPRRLSPRNTRTTEHVEAMVIAAGEVSLALLLHTYQFLTLPLLSPADFLFSQKALT